MSEILDKIDVKEDRRVRKTKKVLRNCLFKLLEEKSINEITVTELTEMADINRSTFYLYYSNVFDMMEKIQDEIFNIINMQVIYSTDNFSQPEDFIKYVQGILEFCKDNYNLCRFVARNHFQNQLADRIVAAIKSIVPNSEKVFSSEDPRYYMTTFALSGISAAILAWMDDSMRIPCEDMAKFLVSTYVFGSKMQKEGDFYMNYSCFQNEKF